MSARVEFCGIPASGKSTVCAGAIKLLRSRGMMAVSRSELVSDQLRRRSRGLIANTIAALVPGWREALLGLSHGMDDWIRFAATYPSYVALVHAWIAGADKQEEWREAISRAIATTAFEFQLGREERRGEERRGALCLDEGFFQRFFSLRGYGVAANSNDAERYVDVAPRPDALIWVATPAEVCAERIRQRARPPLLMRNESDESQLALLRHGTNLLQRLADAAEQRGIPTLKISSESDADSTIRNVADFVEQRR